MTETGVRIGADVGATLLKVIRRRPGGPAEYRILPTTGIEQLAREVELSPPEFLAVTGGGAPELAERLQGCETARVDEFAAWEAGARRLLADQGQAPPGRYLLVSLGTGTSVLLVDGRTVNRVGGTALGGGTLSGLGRALIDVSEFDELAILAGRGDRRRVDLLLSDVYRSGDSPLPGGFTASALAKLARRDSGEEPSPEDLAHALMGLVGENVGLLCGWIASASGVESIVYGGSTLRENPSLVEILLGLGAAFGRETRALSKGEFAGAVGALELAGA